MPIYELRLTNLGPFDDVHFEFDPHLNVFVGPNNCGKSTVLMALADIAVHPFEFPAKLLRRQSAQFIVRQGPTLAKSTSHKGRFPPDKETYSRGAILRDIGYSCLIPALRWSTDYRAESAAPGNKARTKRRPLSERVAGPPRREQQEMLFFDEAPISDDLANDLAKREGLFRTSAALVRDEATIQKIIDLDYRAYREKNPAIRRVLDKIAAIASEITDGFPIEFLRVAEDEQGLYPEFNTPDGKLPLNVLSQGTQSIIQWLALLLMGYAEYYDFPKDLEKKPGVVIIDEIDAHMHPSWQRRILPALSRNFPKLQVFCSSHSPLVLAGLKAGQAQLLKRDSNRKVVVTRNETDLVGWSTDEILRNFLDIINPTDLGTSDKIERLQELRGKRRLTPKQKEELEKLRDTLSQDLLAGPVANEIERFAQLVPKPAPTPRSSKKGSPKKPKKVSTSRGRQAGGKRKRKQA